MVVLLFKYILILFNLFKLLLFGTYLLLVVVSSHSKGFELISPPSYHRHLAQDVDVDCMGNDIEMDGSHELNFIYFGDDDTDSDYSDDSDSDFEI